MSLRDQHAALAASILAAHQAPMLQRINLLPSLTYEMIDLLGELIAAIETLERKRANDS